MKSGKIKDSANSGVQLMVNEIMDIIGDKTDE